MSKLNGRRIESPTDLSPREYEIVDRLSQGLSRKEIAIQLGISVRTAGNYFTRGHENCLYDKTDRFDTPGLLISWFRDYKNDREWIRLLNLHKDPEEINYQRRSGKAREVVNNLTVTNRILEQYIETNPRSPALQYAKELRPDFLAIEGLALIDTNPVGEALDNVRAIAEKLESLDNDKALAQCFVLKGLLAYTDAKYKDMQAYSAAASDLLATIPYTHFGTIAAMLEMVSSAKLGNQKQVEISETKLQELHNQDQNPDLFKQVLNLRIRGWAWGIFGNTHAWSNLLEAWNLSARLQQGSTRQQVATARIALTLLEVARILGLDERVFLERAGRTGLDAASALQIRLYEAKIRTVMR